MRSNLANFCRSRAFLWPNRCAGVGQRVTWFQLVGVAVVAAACCGAPLHTEASQPQPMAARHPQQEWAVHGGPERQVFFDTLPVRCSRTGRGFVSAVFSITLQKASAGVGSGTSSNANANANTATFESPALQLTFWKRGVEHFSTRIWSGHEPAGAISTLRMDINRLPPVAGLVLRNTGHGLRLLQGGDFSFSVSDRAALLTARLTFRCAGDAFNFATVEVPSVIGNLRRGDAGFGRGDTGLSAPEWLDR